MLDYNERCTEELEKLAGGAHQLFHIRYRNNIAIEGVMDSSENIIFQYYPSGYDGIKNETEKSQAKVTPEDIYKWLQ